MGNSLDEKAIEMALRSAPKQQTGPYTITATDSGIEHQARRLASGELTMKQLRDADLPESLIAEVERRSQAYFK